MIIKIFKYICEENNVNFQILFFNVIKINTGFISINLFDLMISILQKSLIFAKWEQVNYVSDEKNISYFYDLFFCMLELSIEMIQGTRGQNTELIIDSEGYKMRILIFINF